MAKRKPREAEVEALLSGDDPAKLKLRHLILAIQPRLFDVLIEMSGTSTANAFAGKLKTEQHGGLDQTLLSKYRKGKTLALHNLPGIAWKTCGLSFGELAWLIGTLLVERFKKYAFRLPEQPRELRERQHRYDPHLPTEQVEDIVARDLRGLEPEDVVDLNLTRRAIARGLEALRDGLQSLLDSITAWERTYSTARQRARRQP